MRWRHPDPAPDPVLAPLGPRRYLRRLAFTSTGVGLAAGAPLVADLAEQQGVIASTDELALALALVAVAALCLARVARLRRRPERRPGRLRALGLATAVALVAASASVGLVQDRWGPAVGVALALLVVAWLAHLRRAGRRATAPRGQPSAAYAAPPGSRHPRHWNPEPAPEPRAAARSAWVEPPARPPVEPAASTRPTRIEPGSDTRPTRVSDEPATRHLDAARAPSPPARSGDLVLPERWRLLDHLADGGMGSVWRAEDRRLGRVVAVKVLARELAQDRLAVARFEREAKAVAGLSGHPHIVTIFDVGECDGRPFLVMEHLGGGSLARLLDRGRPLDRTDVAAWVREAALGLDAAHRRGVVHRDVKPANLLLDEHGRLKVADFGIARLQTAAVALTAVGQVLGTAAYMPPEQARGQIAGPEADQYALAVVAGELLAGQRGPGAWAFVPVGAEPVLRRAVASQPHERWGSVLEFADALEGALESRVERSRGLSWTST